MSLAVANIIEAGKVCNNQKEALGHGNFKAWVASELDVSYETVVNWMRVAKEFGDKNVNLTFLKPSTLYALAAPSTPEPVREAVLERAASGEKVTAKEIEALKKKLAAVEAKAAFWAPLAFTPPCFRVLGQLDPKPPPAHSRFPSTASTQRGARRDEIGLSRRCGHIAEDLLPVS